MQKINTIIAIISLVIIAALIIFTKKRSEKRFSTLAGLSFAFIIAGAVFGESRLVGYGLIGIGVLIAFVDIIRKLKK